MIVDDRLNAFKELKDVRKKLTKVQADLQYYTMNLKQFKVPEETISELNEVKEYETEIAQLQARIHAILS